MQRILLSIDDLDKDVESICAYKFMYIRERISEFDVLLSSPHLFVHSYGK